MRIRRLFGDITESSVFHVTSCLDMNSEKNIKSNLRRLSIFFKHSNVPCSKILYLLEMWKNNEIIRIVMAWTRWIRILMMMMMYQFVFIRIRGNNPKTFFQNACCPHGFWPKSIDLKIMNNNHLKICLSLTWVLFLIIRICCLQMVHVPITFSSYESRCRN